MNKEGDCNFKFFHRVANEKQNRKFIKSLMFKEGESLDNIENSSKEIIHCLGKLYSKPLGASWRIEGLN